MSSAVRSSICFEKQGPQPVAGAGSKPVSIVLGAPNSEVRWLTHSTRQCLGCRVALTMFLPSMGKLYVQQPLSRFVDSDTGIYILLPQPRLALSIKVVPAVGLLMSCRHVRQVACLLYRDLGPMPVVYSGRRVGGCLAPLLLRGFSWLKPTAAGHAACGAAHAAPMRPIVRDIPLLISPGAQSEDHRDCLMSGLGGMACQRGFERRACCHALSLNSNHFGASCWGTDGLPLLLWVQEPLKNIQ